MVRSRTCIYIYRESMFHTWNFVIKFNFFFKFCYREGSFQLFRGGGSSLMVAILQVLITLCPLCPVCPIFSDQHSSTIPSWPSILDPIFNIFYISNILSNVFHSGPALSGSLVKTFGFGAMLTGCGIVCFLYCPLLLLLRYFLVLFGCSWYFWQFLSLLVKMYK